MDVGRRSRRAMIAGWYGSARVAGLLSDPEILYRDPPLSKVTGLSYDAKAEVLYEVGWRRTDIETGMFLGPRNAELFVAGINPSTGQTTFVIQDGTELEETLNAVAVDEENSLLFVAGSTKGEYAVGGPGGDSWETGERALFSDFLVIAMNANGGTIWAYQDAGRLPSEDWLYSNFFLGNTFQAMAFDEPRGLLHLGGEIRGCLGEGCTLLTESNNANFVSIALNASNGELVWQRQFLRSATDYGSARAVVVDEADGVVFIGGGTSGNVTRTASSTNSAPSSDFEDMLVVALEAASGLTVWTWQVGTMDDEAVLALAYGDDSGVLYACGYTTGNISDEFSAQETSDVVVAALNATDGNTIWLRAFSSDLVNGDDVAYALTYVASTDVDNNSGGGNFPGTRENGVLHVSGSTSGKWFDTASGDRPFKDSESTDSLNTVFMTMTLNASDGAVISVYQSPDEDNPSTFYASTLVPSEADGDVYLGGIEGGGLSQSGVIYERHHPVPAHSPVPAEPVVLSPTYPPSQPPTPVQVLFLTQAPSSTPILVQTAEPTPMQTRDLTPVPVVSPTPHPTAVPRPPPLTPSPTAPSSPSPPSSLPTPTSTESPQTAEPTPM
ncbi:unnamed protein product [Ascophyllum nodosum]